jgi:predicted HTH transcriptional regulator
VTNEDLKKLLEVRAETPTLDYKQGLNWKNATPDGKVELVKDILAMSNTRGGGDIVLGVRDNDFEPVGLPEDDFDSFDQTSINDFLHRYTDPPFSCQIYKLTVDAKRFVVVRVPEFREMPIICMRDANSTKTGKLILRNGGLYLRTEKATSQGISNSYEMRELLERAITRAADKLASQFKSVMEAASKHSEEARPPKPAPGEPIKASTIPNLSVEES